MGDKFKISDLQSANLQELAKNVNTFYGDNDKEGKISKKELKKLREMLNGEEYKDAKAELANESDDIKKVFGYKSSVKAEATKVPETAAQVKNDYDTASGKKSGQVVKDAYYKYRGVNPITREPLKDENGNPVKGLSPKAAYEAVAKDCENNKELKDAVKDLKKYSIDTEAKLVVIDAVDRATAKKSKDVKKEAEAILKAEGNWDKHTEKALNGKGHNWWSNTLNWASGKQSDMKLIRKAQAAGNKAAEKATKTYSKKDFTDAIGKKSPLFKEDEKGFMAIEKLTNVEGEQLVTRTADGFDISRLSEFISLQIGSDNTLSRQSNKPDAELEVIRAEFRKQGVELTKRDTKQLVEFCGYRVERKNYIESLYDSTLGAVAAAAGTATALATQARSVVRGEVSNHNHLELNLKIDASAVQSLLNDPEMKKLIGDGAAQISEVSGGVQVIIDQKYVQPFLHISSRHILLNTLKSAAVGAAVGLLAGLLSPGPSEKDVFSTRFSCRTYEDFIDYVDARKELTDAQKLALKQVAVQFIAENAEGKPMEIKSQKAKRDANGALVLDTNGKPVMEETTRLVWDCEGFKDYLNSQAGYTSNLNRVELFKAIKNAPAEDPEVQPEAKQEEKKEEKPVEQKVYIAQDTSVKDIDKFQGANKHSWPDLVKMYDCIDNQPYKVQVRFLKAMQGFKKTDFTYEQIMQIVEVSKPGKKVTEATKAAIKALDFITDDNFDVDMFAAHVNTPGAVGDDDKNIIALREIKDANGNVVCTRDDSRVTRTISRNRANGGSKGKTAGQYSENSYWHRDASGKVDRDASQQAQATWAEGQRQKGATVTPVQGGKKALEEIQ